MRRPGGPLPVGSPTVLRRLLPVCLAAILAACGGTADPAPGDAVAPSPTEPPASASAAPAEATAPPNVDVPEALQLSAPLVGGGEIELGALAGRPVLLWFWAPW